MQIYDIIRILQDKKYANMRPMQVKEDKMTSQKPLSLVERTEIAVKEIRAWRSLGCKNAKLLHGYVCQSFFLKTKEYLNRADYDTAIKIIYDEENK